MYSDELENWEDKFFVWGRKIDERINWYEDQNYDKEVIIEYLEKCADMREKYLDPNDLTDVEEHWTEEINAIFRDYGVSDPIYDLAFGN